MIKELFASARLVPHGPVLWRMYIPNTEAHVYALVRDGEVVYIGQDPSSGCQRLQGSSGQQAGALWAYWAATNDPHRDEAEMLRWFKRYSDRLPSGN